MVFVLSFRLERLSSILITLDYCTCLEIASISIKAECMSPKILGQMEKLQWLCQQPKDGLQLNMLFVLPVCLKCLSSILIYLDYCTCLEIAGI